MKIKQWMVFLLLSTVFTCTNQNEIVHVKNLRCEYLPQPLGLDVRQPRLSWALGSTKRGVLQSSYRILVASSVARLNQSQGDLWDSGQTASNRSFQISYGGVALNSRQPVYWKVMVWDQDNRPSKWSAEACWEMALLEQTDWQAHWIGAPDADAAAEPPAPLLRKTFNLSKNISQARLYISGLGYYEASLNGRKISDHVLSPNQSNYDRRKQEEQPDANIGNMSTTIYYETFDVTNLISSGDNALGVVLGNGWYRQQDRLKDTPLWYDTPRLLAQLEVTYKDGRRQIIVSDNSWKSGASPILHNGLHTGEIYDSRQEQVGWDLPQFNDKEWPPAIIVRAPTGKLSAQFYPADRIVKTLPAQALTMPEPGIHQYDFGQMISGWARLKIKGPAGTAVKLRFFEEMGPSYGQMDTYILKGNGIEVWEPRFTWHAFRYVQVLDAPELLSIGDLEGRVVNTDVDTVGTFVCSNPLFNKILENYRWTQLGNMHGGVPSDCPHRERRGYTGDGQISARSAIYTFDMALFYSKWVNDIRDAQNNVTGYVPNTAPWQDGGGGTAWGSAYVLLPWYMYLYYGDMQILKDHYDGMKKWLIFLTSRQNAKGILFNQGLGEWVPPDIVELPAEFVNTSYYYHNLDVMTRVAGVLGRPTDAEQYSAAAEQTRRNINRHFLNSDHRSYSIGRQGADVFPLGFSITPDSLIQPVFSHLIDNILIKNQGHFDTGILATPLLLDVLTCHGRSELAYILMNQHDFPGFGYMLEKGATTIWETWQGDQSHSHPMFGSVCRWFYESLAGIAPDPSQPGFQHILMQPHPVAGLNFVKAGYQAPAGLIRSHWQFVKEDYLWEISLPANTTATVLIPARSPEHVTESGKPAGQGASVRYRGTQDGCAVYDIGSGDYYFRSEGIRANMRKPIPAAPDITPGDTLVEIPHAVHVRIQPEAGSTNKCDIRYTLDGSEPDLGSALYTESFSVDRTVVLKAKIFQSGIEPGFTRTRLIQFVDPQRNGVTFNFYEGQWEKLPNFAAVAVRKTGRVYQFTLEDIAGCDDLFALQYSGRIRIDTPGVYSFYLLSNDGSRLDIDDKRVVDHDGQHGVEEKSGTIRLAAGLHSIRVGYFQAGGGMYLKVSYSGPDMVKREIPADVLYQ